MPYNHGYEAMVWGMASYWPSIGWDCLSLTQLLGSFYHFTDTAIDSAAFRVVQGDCEIVYEAQGFPVWLHNCWVVLLTKELSHWGQDKMDAILQPTFWTAFSWMRINKFQLNFHWSLFLKVQQYSSIGWDNDMALTWRQAIIWINDALVNWHLYSPLDLNELSCAA